MRSHYPAAFIYQENGGKLRLKQGRHLLNRIAQDFVKDCCRTGQIGNTAHRFSRRSEEISPATPGVWLSISRAEQAQVCFVHQCRGLQRLPGLQQQVVHLRFVYGLRCQEITEVLGKKEGAVRKLLWRALNLVRSLYTEE